jgi:glycoside/pentoside/hexuronide:cation symporter, GPH family
MTLARRGVFAYGLFGLPLAFVALPIYVHVPHLYSSAFGMSLALVGTVLLIARLGDAIVDPIIGVLSDRWPQRKLAIALALPALALGLWGLLRPISDTPGALWLVSMLALVYLGYSLASVNHNAWGAELSNDPHERTRITATREGLGLAGVVLASVLPGLLSDVTQTGMARLAIVFVALLIGCACVTFGFAPLRAVGAQPVERVSHGSLLQPVRSARFRALLWVFAISGIAAAIPASLVLFFIADVLQAEAKSGAFLAIYFVCAAAGLPGWVWLSRRIGKLRAWLAAMVLAVLVFVWAGTLGTGDVLAYGVICALSGLALGADLALPPSMLADTVERDALGAGSSFGWWNFVTKLNLALAAGLSLPLLQSLNYTPGQRDADGLVALAVVYAAVPAVLKLVAAALLWRGRHLIAEN